MDFTGEEINPDGFYRAVYPDGFTEQFTRKDFTRMDFTECLFFPGWILPGGYFPDGFLLTVLQGWQLARPARTLSPMIVETGPSGEDILSNDCGNWPVRRGH